MALTLTILSVQTVSIYPKEQPRKNRHCIFTKSYFTTGLTETDMNLTLPSTCIITIQVPLCLDRTSMPSIYSLPNPTKRERERERERDQAATTVVSVIVIADTSSSCACP